MPAWNLALLGFGLSIVLLWAALSTLASGYGRYHHIWDASSLFSLVVVALTGPLAVYLLFCAIRKATQKQAASDETSPALPAARVSANYRIAMAVAIILGVGMMGFAAYDVVMEYERGRSVSRLQSKQASIKVRLDAIAKEFASLKPSDGRSRLESLRARLEAIEKENDALKRDVSTSKK